MEDLKSWQIKKCFVPTCSNSTRHTSKIFFGVPTNKKRRKLWWTLVRRTDPCPLTRWNLYICEDHFDFEKDTNWIKWKLLGGRLSLKADTVPHLNLGETKDEQPTSILANEIKEKFRSYLENKPKTASKVTRKYNEHDDLSDVCKCMDSNDQEEQVSHVIDRNGTHLYIISNSNDSAGETTYYQIQTDENEESDFSDHAVAELVIETETDEIIIPTTEETEEDTISNEVSEDLFQVKQESTEFLNESENNFEFVDVSLTNEPNIFNEDPLKSSGKNIYVVKQREEHILS